MFGNRDTATERGVTPVIGIILMVAITVILAATVAVMAFQFGQDSNQDIKTASFGFDYRSDAGELTITHRAGSTIKRSDVYVRGSGFTGSGAMSGPGKWLGEASATSGGTDAVSSGDSVTFGASPSYDLKVVYQPSDGDKAVILARSSGPNA
jgi:flagellin-like protein